MSGPADDLEEALAALERLAKEEGTPDRYDARALLVPLGTRLLAGEDASQALERAGRIGELLGEAWEGAVANEISLACAEHIHAVDPRYLDLPNYDFAYTELARERLEARLLAIRALGLSVPATLETGVRLADERLAPYLADRLRDRNS